MVESAVRSVARPCLALLVVALVGVAGCGGESEPRTKRSAPKAASSSATAGASDTATAGDVTDADAPAGEVVPSPAAQPSPAARAETAPSTGAAATAFEPAGRLVLRLSAPARLAGVSARVLFDEERIELGEAEPLDALSGFACQANVLPGGEARLACAGLVGEERGGELAAFPILASPGADPSVGDFELAEVELVDFEAQPLTEHEVLLAVDG